MEKDKINKVSILSALFGHAIEKYDVSLYAYCATIIGSQFFSAKDQHSYLMTSFFVFSISYLSRPFGGFIFGYIGDKFGRKKAFLYSIFLIFFPTIAIAFLPTYNSIGYTASVTIIVMRILQGFSYGGGSSGAPIFVAEHAYDKNLGWWGSLTCSAGLVGGLIGTALGTLFTSSYFPDWAWRIPFFLGIFTIVLAYIIRKKASETPLFIEMQNKQIKEESFLYFIKKHFKHLLATTLIAGCATGLHYASTLFFTGLYSKKFGVTAHENLKITSWILLVWIIAVPISGRFSEYFTIKKFMQTTSIVSLPLIYLVFKQIDITDSIQITMMYQIIFSLICINYTGPMYGILIQLFPVHIRYRCIATSLTLGQAIFGATCPAITNHLLDYEMGIIYASFYMIFLLLIGLLGLTIISPKS